MYLRSIVFLFSCVLLLLGVVFAPSADIIFCDEDTPGGIRGALEEVVDGKVNVNSTINMPSNVIVNEPTIISGVLSNTANGQGVAGVTLKILISGYETHMSVITDSNGAWSLNYTPSQVGNYTVTVSLRDDPVYNNFQNTTNFTVNKVDVNSTINTPQDASVNELALISGVLSNQANGVPVGNTQLTVSIYDDTGYNLTMYSVTNQDGEWVINEYTPINRGEHTVTVSLKDHTFYNDFTNTSSFIVNKIGVNSTIEVPTDAVVGEEASINGTLSTSNGNPIGGVTLDLTIGNIAETVTTNEDGEWTYNYTPTKCGEHTVTISLTDHPVYNDFTNSTNFTVGKATVNSTINAPPEVNLGDTININGKLSNPIGGVALDLTINDDTTTVTTDKNGDWSTTYTSTTMGTHTVTVSLTGHQSYNDFTNTSSFTVQENNNKISVNSTINTPSHTIVNKETSINGTLADNYRKPISGVTLDLTIDDVRTKITTGNNGRWTYKYTPTRIGECFVKISLKNHPIYKSFSNTTTFPVKKKMDL